MRLHNSCFLHTPSKTHRPQALPWGLLFHEPEAPLPGVQWLSRAEHVSQWPMSGFPNSEAQGALVGSGSLVGWGNSLACVSNFQPA